MYNIIEENCSEKCMTHGIDTSNYYLLLSFAIQSKATT